MFSVFVIEFYGIWDAGMYIVRVRGVRMERLVMLEPMDFSFVFMCSNVIPLITQLPKELCTLVIRIGFHGSFQSCKHFYF